MVLFSDSQKIVDRFGEYIQEFQDAFIAHNVDFGSPDDFFAFARSLKSNQPLQRDLSHIVRSLMEKESGNISLRIVFTIIAIASGGPEIALANRDMSRPVNLVIDFLISAAGGTQIDANHLDSMYSMEEPVEQDIPEEEGEEDEDHDSFFDEPTEEEEEGDNFRSETNGLHLKSNYPAGSIDLNQSLARLEMSTLEVKLYLDSIDQRISRMEPHLEGFQSHAPVPAEQDAKPEDPVTLWAAASLPVAEPAAEPETHEIPAEIPVEPAEVHPRAIPSRERLALWPVLIGLAILFVGVLLYRISTRTDVHPVTTGAPVSPANSIPATAGTATEITNSSTSTPINSNFPSPNTAAAAKTPQSRSANERVAPPWTSPVSGAAQNSAAAQPSNPPHSSEAEKNSPDEASDSATSAAPAPTDAAPRSEPPTPRMVTVSSGVMATNLVSAPMPAYPKLAKLAHMQGDVVLQAKISRRGTVENLRVIRGHRLLRSAAEDAVKSWRYKPYLVNGKPVEVATFVTVKFDLKRGVQRAAAYR